MQLPTPFNYANHTIAAWVYLKPSGLDKFVIDSGDERLDRQVNTWNQYQCMITFNFSRSASYFESGIGRGMGFRDSNQDLLGFVHQAPLRARQRIIDIASTQFPDGGCYHQYQPLTKRGNNEVGGGFNDDPMWLILGATAYIKETGDYTLLEEMVPYDNDDSLAQTMFHHLTVSFDHVVNNLGPNGLPLIGRADWNDCLELGHDGETVFVAFQLRFALKTYIEICGLMNKHEEVEWASQHLSTLDESLNHNAWDGQHNTGTSAIQIN